MFLKYFLGFRAPSVICLIGWILFEPQLISAAATTCPPPDFPVGGSYTPNRTEYEVGERIIYACKDRFLMFGEDRMTCQSNGRWKGKTPFCDSPIKIKNPTASSYFKSRPYDAIDGKPNTCFQTQNNTGQSLTVFLERPSAVYAVRINLSAGTTAIKILLSPHRGNAALCSMYNGYIAEKEWVLLNCEYNDMKAVSVKIQDIGPKSSYISVCEIEVYAKDDSWCTEPPENLNTNGQLEVSRSRAILSCNEGYQNGNYSRVYGNCEGNKWSYLRTQCTEILCKPGNHSEGEWHIDDKTGKLSAGTNSRLQCRPGYDIQGGPTTVTCLKNGTWTETSATCKKAKDYKIIGIAVGAVVAVVILFLLGLTIFLIQRKRAREVVVIYKPGESNSYSAPPSVGGHSTSGLSEAEYSTIYYEAIQSSQNDPRNPPPKPPSIAPKLEKGYSKPADERFYQNTDSSNRFPNDLSLGTLTKSSSLYNSLYRS